MKADPRATAAYLGEFFKQLVRCGVRHVVVSPGSRSTPLAMAAFELSQRRPDRLQVTVDVDERGAAFVALGIGKATGVPAAAVCTSGTAVANWYPAVLEAESSRVPLLLLSGDRPPQLQGLGAPQTCDQLHAFGSHVRAFRQMMLPSDDPAALAFARQAALEAVLQAQGEAAAPKRVAGACNGGPVHLNFPFDEPLKPDFSAWDADTDRRFESDPGATVRIGALPGSGLSEGLGEEVAGAEGSMGKSIASESRLLGGLPSGTPLSPILWARGTLDCAEADRLAKVLLDAERPLVLAGEGTCATDGEAATILNWVHSFGLPLLADPLSGLRRFGDLAVIDGYDSIIGTGGEAPESLRPTLIVRFGRYPVSKKATQMAASTDALSIVVDRHESRDFNAGTDCLVACDPVDFAKALTEARDRLPAEAPAGEEYLHAWQQANRRAATARDAISSASDRCQLEGAYVRAALELAPEGALVFAANSMSVRALDTFYPKGRKLTVLCNRGLNGIDGTLSTAIGATLGAAVAGIGAPCSVSPEKRSGDSESLAAESSLAKATFIAGDLTLQHDLNALALQRELLREGGAHVSLVVVLLNNNGGAIFDMLPQCSDDPYFERLFLTPQDVDFQAAAQAFDVPSWLVESVEDFEAAYRQALAKPGLSLVEVKLPLRGVKERYRPYWEIG